MTHPALPNPEAALSEFLLAGESAVLHDGEQRQVPIQGRARSHALPLAQRLLAMRQMLQAGENLRVNLENGDVEWLTSTFGSGPISIQPVQVNIQANSRTYNVHQQGLVNRTDTAERDLNQVVRTEQLRADNPELYASLTAINGKAKDKDRNAAFIGCVGAIAASVAVFVLLRSTTELNIVYSLLIAVTTLFVLFMTPTYLHESRTKRLMRAPVAALLKRHSVTAASVLAQIEDEKSLKYVVAALNEEVAESP